ncbi:MAG: hypothetical protein HC765_03980, partial [Brachymonas sp.]|nr:hypothetical protein [Brachymonas sp.]
MQSPLTVKFKAMAFLTTYSISPAIRETSTLNAIAGNGTNIGTVDIFSSTGTVNLNNNITTSAGTNINVVGSSVNVGNPAQLRAGNLIYIGTNSNASANTINIATGSQLFAQDGNLTLSAEDNIFINGNVGGYGDVNIVSSAGSVVMNNLINVTGYQTAGTVGSRSASIHGQTGVTLAHVNASTIYNATVTTGAGQTIASAGSVTNLAGFNDIFLGSSTVERSNIGSSGAPIRFGTMNSITAYGDLNLYFLAQTGGANLNITNASVDTGTSSTANAEFISNGNLNIDTFSVLGTGTAHLDFLASQNTHITGTVTGNANSDMVLAADEFLILGALPNSITNFNHVGLQGRSNNQNIRFIDTIGPAVAGTTQITYAQNQYLANSVGHVIVGKTANGGNIEFTGSGNLAPSTLTSARNYS